MFLTAKPSLKSLVLFSGGTQGPKQNMVSDGVGTILHLPMPNILTPDSIIFNPREGITMAHFGDKVTVGLSREPYGAGQWQGALQV